MGQSSSNNSRHSNPNNDDNVDYGSIHPWGVYQSSPQDWNFQVVASLILERRLAPFYQPLEDYEPTWDDNRVFAARKSFPQHPSHDPESPPNTPSTADSTSSHRQPPPRINRPTLPPPKFAALYRGAVECPICFLYYPSNINHSRCCSHPICTECFVQIKRSEPSPTHLVSDPACCPYCVQDCFGVVYSPPPWRAGVGAENSSRHLRPEAMQTLENNSGSKSDSNRRKSLSADSSEVVTIDQIRPDWEQKLAAVKAAVQRRANRRIIMRQVGDRLIPVGVTSGRIHPIGQDFPSSATGTETPQGEEATRSRRGRRGGAGVPAGTVGPTMDLTQFLGLNGQDIEEMMVMEAIRLSMVEHEEAQRRQAREGNGNAASGTPDAASRSPTPNPQNTTPLSFLLSGRQPTPPVPSLSSSPSNSHHTPPPPPPPHRAPANISSPLAQAASNIALSFGLPDLDPNTRSRSRTPTPNPTPTPASRDSETRPEVGGSGAGSEAIATTTETGPASTSADGVGETIPDDHRVVDTDTQKLAEDHPETELADLSALTLSASDSLNHDADAASTSRTDHDVSTVPTSSSKDRGVEDEGANAIAIAAADPPLV